jgi:hypothetical protein
MPNIEDHFTHSTEEQREAINLAKHYIQEDGDRAGKVIMSDNFDMRIDQWEHDGDYVRTWIAKPDGKLTWKS